MDIIFQAGDHVFLLDWSDTSSGVNHHHIQTWEVFGALDGWTASVPWCGLRIKLQVNSFKYDIMTVTIDLGSFSYKSLLALSTVQTQVHMYEKSQFLF